MNRKESKYFQTAKKMDEALVQLLEKKEFAYINIKELCILAGVNRSTFYLHYQNLNDLLEEVIGDLETSFHEHFSKASKPDLKSEKLEDLYLITDEYLLPYLRFIKENRAVYRACKDHPELFSADKMQSTMYVDFLNPILERFQVPKERREYLIEYYIKGINALVLRWCGNGCDLDEKEIADLIESVIMPSAIEPQN